MLASNGCSTPRDQHHTNEIAATYQDLVDLSDRERNRHIAEAINEELVGRERRYAELRVSSTLDRREITLRATHRLSTCVNDTH
jgi:hypothetical protein